METVTINSGTRDWVLAELNRTQAIQVMKETYDAFANLPEKEKEAELRAELGRIATKTIILCINNAQVWPSPEKPLGDETYPFSAADLEASFTFRGGPDKHREMHAAALKLNDLFQDKPAGEPQAETSESTGTLSASAS